MADAVRDGFVMVGVFRRVAVLVVVFVAVSVVVPVSDAAVYDGDTIGRSGSLSSVGRFLSADPVQPNAPGSQGFNRYAYVVNNPTTWTDPSGHTLVEYSIQSAGISGAVSGGVGFGVSWFTCTRDTTSTGLLGGFSGCVIRDTVAGGVGGVIGGGFTSSGLWTVLGSAGVAGATESVVFQGLQGDIDPTLVLRDAAIATVFAGVARTAARAWTQRIATRSVAPRTTSLVGTSYGNTGTVVSNPGITIKGFQGSSQPGHALNQVINRGVRPQMLVETTRNPLVVLQQAGNRYLYLTDDAVVVLTGDGQVATAWTRAEFFPHIQQILRDAGGAP